MVLLITALYVAQVRQFIFLQVLSTSGLLSSYNSIFLVLL
jgi:hypothetical protein